jgi:RimJ/RimL family protein N-acetyltransferase
MQTPIPTLPTERLILRPFSLADAPAVQQLAGDRQVAETTANIPHPYEDGMAEAWIGRHEQGFAKDESATWAMVAKPGGPPLGAISLMLNLANAYAELGYWVGRPYWNHGYCTEAAAAVVKYAFEDLGLNRVQARHMTRNPASGRVMQKIGMAHEGKLRQQARRWGVFEDLEMYAILLEEYEAARRTTEQMGK